MNIQEHSNLSDWPWWFKSGLDIAHRLRQLANHFEAVGELPAGAHLNIMIQPSVGRGTVQQRAESVDLIAAALDLDSHVQHMGNGDWHYRSEGAPESISVFTLALERADYEAAWIENEQYDRDLAALADTTGVVQTAQAASVLAVQSSGRGAS